jgi:ElaB/YqjD/DUF883 family membrane-anchored ribosome-binding protein
MKTVSDEVSKDQLLADFKLVVADAEALLHATANQGDHKLAEVRAKVEESLNAMKSRMAEAQAALLERTRAAAKATDTYVHENPWQAVGIAAGVGAGIGLLIGLLIGRR